jgi:hypothetical protein
MRTENQAQISEATQASKTTKPSQENNQGTPADQAGRQIEAEGKTQVERKARRAKARDERRRDD